MRSLAGLRGQGLAMQLYAEVPARRTRQIVLDGLVLVWVVIWVRIGMALYHVVDKLRAVGTTMSDAGGGFAGTMDRIAGDIGRVPLAGGSLRAPFRDAAGAGRSLQDAGVRQSHDVHTMAIWLGVLVALLPIAYLLARYLSHRYRYVREATAAVELRAAGAAPRLLAIRAAATRPLEELVRLSSDPMTDIDEGRYDRLASLEFEALGLRH